MIVWNDVQHLFFLRLDEVLNSLVVLLLQLVSHLSPLLRQSLSLDLVVLELVGLLDPTEFLIILALLFLVFEDGFELIGDLGAGVDELRVVVGRYFLQSLDLSVNQLQLAVKHQVVSDIDVQIMN